MDAFDDVLINLQCELVAERNRVNPKEISWLHYDILHLLAQKECLLPSEVSALLGISRTKLSKALKKLKLMGYIEQKPSVRDGRELQTVLSTDGHTLLATIENGHNQLAAVACNLFTEQEQQQFARLASKFANALRSGRVNRHE